MKGKRSRKPSLGIRSTNSKRSRKSSIITSTHEAISTQDVMINIFNRLPLITLGMLACVSKSFYRMITEWTKLRRPPHLIGFFAKDEWGKFDSETRWVDYIDYEHNVPMDSARAACVEFLDYESLDVVASSNGILLCCSAPIKPEIYHLFNPVTRQHIVLPRLHYHAPRYDNVKIGFDCQIVAGTVQYTVLLIGYGYMRVFSSRDECPMWKDIAFDRTKINGDHTTWRRCYHSSRLSVTVGGVFYWHRYVGRGNKHVIVACNPLGSEGRLFWNVELPEPLLSGTKHQYWLGAVRNSRLYLGATLDNGKEVRVWVCEESNRANIGGADHVQRYKWKLEHTLRLDKSLARAYQKTQSEPPSQFNYSLFVFKGFHPCVPGVIFFSFHDSFMSYSFKNGSFERYSKDLRQNHTQLSFIPFEWMPSGYPLSRQSKRRKK